MWCIIDLINYYLSSYLPIYLSLLLNRCGLMQCGPVWSRMLLSVQVHLTLWLVGCMVAWQAVAVPLHSSECKMHFI